MKLSTLNAAIARDAFAHLLAVGICSAVLFLFAALTYSQITLPRYTTNYTEKDVQQVVNLLITILATVIGILFSHCRRLTNEAETKTELRNEELTIPRLHVHFEAASGSKVAMGLPVIRNKSVYRLVAFYFAAMIIFAFIHSVLSVIFVIEDIISDKGEPVPVAIPLSIDIPYKFDGVVVDPCTDDINSPKCTYVLALHAMSSQLVTYQSYSIAGVTFDPRNGTMGLPYYAMKHFADEVASIPFENARRRYCLPVLDPHLIKCTEVPINHTTCESIDGKFVKFKSLNVSEYNQYTREDTPQDTGLYKIASPYPNGVYNYGATKLRIDNQGLGVMVSQMYSEDPFTTMIGAADPWKDKVGYATLLHRLMYDGADPDISDVPEGSTYDFAARCEMTQIKYQDNLGSSWRQVDFTLNAGVLRANVTEERCPNGRSAGGEGFSGFKDLPYALEGAGAVISGPDGYSTFFNDHPPTGAGSDVFANMSRFDQIVNQVYHLIQTSWSEQTYDLAMQRARVTDEPIVMTMYPHLFVIRMSWTPTTYIGLVLSVLIALNAYTLAARWAMATYRLGFGSDTWNLLRPVDLMAYSLAASQDLIHGLNTPEHRKMEMRGTMRTVLKERPMDLLGFITGAGNGRTGSESNASTPVREYYEKAAEAGVSVKERGADLEKGQQTAQLIPFLTHGERAVPANLNPKLRPNKYQHPMDPSTTSNHESNSAVILSDVIGAQSSINIFASFTRSVPSVSTRLETSALNTTVLAPSNKAITSLPRKPWEDPKDYSQFGAAAYKGAKGDDRAQDNMKRFAEAHVVPESPWEEGVKVKTMGGGEVWWERKEGKAVVMPQGVGVERVVERVANGEVWVVDGVVDYER
ncbi:uncharacterized protein LTR77_003822 [Saxophila tyrrhenica]|uniref:FAS1 domain-containing protein n=1 Tax=Saxophila tyrrhenica TaxID=1690608 RepID=A0AAV9PI93_9PEZI|nr:hypothetical protein LTR77_003822 [Saxophila tyrrhenica]